MAITITDKPYSVTRLGQPLIISASSTNTGNAGFRYVVRVNVSGGSQDYYVAPNPQGRLMFNLMESIKNINNIGISDGKIFTTLFVDASSTSGLFSYGITLFEAWEVDGFLTIQEASQVDVHSEEGYFNFFAIIGSYNVKDGYRPDPSLTYGFAAGATPATSTRLLMGDRDSNTHTPPESFPLLSSFPPATIVAQPVRNNDWGVVNILSGINDTERIFGLGLWIRWVLVKSNLSFESHSERINEGETIYSVAAYPANLNEGGVGTVIPNNFPNYKYYTIQLFNQDPSNAVGLQAMSALYVFYPVAEDCNHDNVRLGWWSPNKGGYDFFNFTKVNEESVSVERKRMAKIVGNYASTTFSLDTTKGGVTELSVKPTTSLEISTDWIQEGEFKLISNIVKSKAVYIINDDGTATPVVVETNTFLSERKRDGKLKRATLRVQMANENYYY